ncbi:diguanylate cyclase (GGDEF) domain-containing protein [Pseudobutyrivibrio sp. YE44]|uniref:GGDEF domain-containing protein n=1 Tax=Pseudobutyrivibrio sp. YE44 TaxID=1520802 RepID=UPI000886575F|nr:GGDEF domain-containing protein [Pseudobutyrivibrio sp. YE44]SDB41395.1 diguanylate cyclase (GGDEF) domain-containing protein [Pseudobutyrivibrio sp. YE44]
MIKLLKSHNQTQEFEDYETTIGLSALDIYLTRVYKFVILAPTSVAALSAVSYTITKLMGGYETVPPLGLALFDLTNVIYFLVALHFYRVGLKGDSLVKQEQLKRHKIAVGVVILIQYNFTIYLIPFNQWWAFAPFFIFFTVFFFDMKLTSWVTIGIMVSTVQSWFIKPEILWVADGVNKTPDILIRISYLTISAILLLSLTHLGGKYLIEELEKYAKYDTLTHLLNRKSMDSYLRDACRHADKGRQPFCLIMADIDDFKKVNDTYGHDCGDEVLKYVAHTILTGVKKTDYVFRWGGEEICIILKCPLEQATLAADRIRCDIAKDFITYKNDVQVSVTVTMGVCEYKPGMSLSNLMNDADEKLYYGKQHGKNQVVNSIQ